MVEMFIIQQRSPIQSVLRVRAKEKLIIPILSSRPEGLTPKLCHLGHHMGWVSVCTQPQYKTLGPDLMKLNDPIGPNF